MAQELHDNKGRNLAAIKLRLNNNDSTKDKTLQTEIFKIIQELITNTIKQTNATAVELQINKIDHVINILFEDGIGFRNIRSRLKKMSGNLHIDSKLKRETIVNIEIPNLINTNDV